MIQPKHKIRVLHLKSLASTGGAERLLEYFGRLVNKEVFQQYAVIAEDGDLVRALRDCGMTVLVRPKMLSYKGLMEIPSLIKFIKKEKINIIHAHGARVNFWGGFASMMTGVPIISTEHGVDIWRHKSRIYECADRVTMSINRARVAVSPSVYEMLIKRMPHNKVYCINNGIDYDLFNKQFDIDKLRTKYGINKDSKVIGAVGRLCIEKGHADLLETVQQIIKVVNNIEVLIAGDGPLFEHLKERSVELGIERNIKFLGNCNRIPELLSIMDIFVLPSRIEGLPLALLEAMASGRIVVASAVGGVPSVIEDEVNGFIYPSGDVEALTQKILFCIKNDTNLSRISDMARRTIKDHYDIRNTINAYEKIYLQSVKNN